MGSETGHEQARLAAAQDGARDRVRAQIVLAAARGRDNARIAADLRVTVDTVRKWRGRSPTGPRAADRRRSTAGAGKRSDPGRSGEQASLAGRDRRPLSRWTGRNCWPTSPGRDSR